MHDIRVEDGLRRSLRDEAASLSFTLTADILERRLAERRRRQAGTSRRRLIAAAAVVVAVTGGAVLLLGPGRLPSIGASPSPTITVGPTNALPEAATLLVDVPAATLRLEGSVGPAIPDAQPNASSGAPGVPAEVGHVTIAGPFVLAAACLGPGDLSVRLTEPSGASVVEYTRPCNGKVGLSEYLTDPPVSGPDGFLVTVQADPVVSWRLAIGTYPEGLSVAPVLPSLTPTAGWDVLMDSGVNLLSPTSSSGLGPMVPAAATRLGVLVSCQGDATIAFEAGTAQLDPIECTTSPSSHRFEIPVTGGERLSLRATADSFVWTRLLVENQGDSAVVRPTAPPLPAPVADARYAFASSAVSLVAVGTIGGTDQELLSIGGARIGASTGAEIPIVVIDPASGASRLDVLSSPDSSATVTVATATQPAVILASWADSEHRIVFYAMTPDQQGETVQYHRVGFDGSGDQVIAASQVDVGRYLFGGSSADLSHDGRQFVMDICDGAACTATILDTATGVARQVPRGADTFCSILGIADDTVIAVAMDACTPFDPAFSLDAAVRVVALPLDGSASRVLVDDVAEGQVVATPTGSVFVFTRTLAGARTTVESVDIATGAFTTIRTLQKGDPIITPMPIRLPDGWVLLATMSLGEFPQAAVGPRAVPLLVDLATGETYEMVNLPH